MSPEHSQPRRLQLHCRVPCADISTIDLLAMHSGLSRGQLKQAMSKGAVWLARGRQVTRTRRAKKPLQPGDSLHLYYDVAVLQEQPPLPRLVADEGGYSVWYKPCGLRSQGSKWGDHCSLPRWVEQHLQPQRPAFIVHRLDRAASGLMLLAHSKTAAAALSALFAKREIAKHYRVVVQGHFDDGGGLRLLDSELDGRRAVSHVRCLDYDEKKQVSLLEVALETGRKHQIRRQLADCGHPVVGDRLYGRAGHGDQDDLQLTACRLGFISPLSAEQKTYELDEALLPTLDDLHC